MSRAFVREDDGSGPEAVPEHPVSAAPNLVTARGKRRISAAIAELTARLAENPDPEQTARLRRDLRYWNLRHATARVVAPAAGDPAAQFGATVRYRTPDGEQKTVTITGEDEADPGSGRIAYTAPVARALIGTAPGDSVTVRLGARLIDLEVLAVTVSADDPADG